METNLARRAFLAKAPFAAVAIATPAIAIAAAETAREKVDRLATELSQALAEFDNGDWHARVFAANQPYAGLQLRLDHVRESQEEKVRRMARMLQFNMAKLPVNTDGKSQWFELNYQATAGTRLRLSHDAYKGDDILIGFLPPFAGHLYEPREI